MKSIRMRIVGLLIIASTTVLAACNQLAPSPTAVPPEASGPTAVAQPTEVAAPTAEPTQASALTGLELPISGAGVVRAAREADLLFQVTGTVAEVYVEEGDTVQEGDLLAILDVRSFDLDIERAEAQLANAQSQEIALGEGGRSADLASANAQVRQAEANLAQVRSGPRQPEIDNAQAAVAAAQANLQQRRDQLSAQKTNAELQVQTAANNVRTAQDNYSRIYWENRELEEDLRRFGRELPQEAKDREAQALRQVQDAETALEQAKINLENAQQAEITGIQAAEEQLAQAQAQLDRLLLPPDANQVAAAEAQLAQARAARARLNPDPTESQQEQVAAAIRQAEVAIEVARINREKAELRAPFGGVVSIVNVDPGDPASTGTLQAIQIVDADNLRVEVQISDSDIARVELGQQANIRVDAIPDRQYTGTVSFIAPTATSSGNVRTYLVRIELDDQEDLRDGMSVRVDIATSS